eukprot:scaffold113_cov339-Pavlova_lutheri.AAC.1
MTERLEGEGVRPGDRVGVMARNCAQVIDLHIACARLEAVVVNLNTNLVSNELEHILEDAMPICLLVDEEGQKMVEECRRIGAKWTETIRWIPLQHKRPQAAPSEGLGHQDEGDTRQNEGTSTRNIRQENGEHAGCMDVLVQRNNLWCRRGRQSTVHGKQVGYQMYYTSGTTGLPKGVLLSQQVVLSHAEGTIAEMSLGRDDVWGHFAPMFHLVDAFAIYAITSLGARHVVPGPFNANSALTLIEQERITCVNFASTMVTMMMSNPKLDRVDLSSMRILSCGGSPIPPANVLRVLSHVGSEFFVSYGMTECCGKISMSLVSEEQRLAREPEGILRSICTSGRPFVLSDVRIVDDGGLDVVPASAQVGHVWVRGHTMFPGYWKNDSANATSFVDGWFCTGDMGLVNEDGYVTIVDRAKDMILCGGENVYCAEVEAALHEHPFVRQAAVIGVPNQVMGELVAAVLVVSEPVTQADIVAFCRLRLSEYKVPYVVEFVDQMPTTGSGKILKTKLRQDFASMHASFVPQVARKELPSSCFSLEWSGFDQAAAPEQTSDTCSETWAFFGTLLGPVQDLAHEIVDAGQSAVVVDKFRKSGGRICPGYMFDLHEGTSNCQHAIASSRGLLEMLSDEQQDGAHICLVHRIFLWARSTPRLRSLML